MNNQRNWGKMMLTHCPYCDKEYKLADELRGKNARCKRCGNVFQLADWEDWLARINPAPTPEEIKKGFDKWDNAIDEICDGEKSNKEFVADMNSFVRDMNNDSSEHTNLDEATMNARKNLSAADAFAAIVPEVTLRNPVPHVYQEFMKVCRALNKEDIKAKRWGAALHRLLLMDALNKKHLDAMWNGILARDMDGLYQSGTRPDETTIREHYSKIAVTDRKNIDKCKTEIAKFAVNNNS